jgi:hypothetical protein
LAPVIVDLITIYDDDSDEMDTFGVPILDESKVGEEVGPTPERPQLEGGVVTTDTTEKVVTPPEQGSQPQNIGEKVQDDKGGNGDEEHSSKIPPLRKRTMKMVKTMEKRKRG